MSFSCGVFAFLVCVLSRFFVCLFVSVILVSFFCELGRIQAEIGSGG